MKDIEMIVSNCEAEGWDRRGFGFYMLQHYGNPRSNYKLILQSRITKKGHDELAAFTSGCLAAKVSVCRVRFVDDFFNGLLI